MLRPAPGVCPRLLHVQRREEGVGGRAGEQLPRTADHLELVQPVANAHHLIAPVQAVPLPPAEQTGYPRTVLSFRATSSAPAARSDDGHRARTGLDRRRRGTNPTCHGRETYHDNEQPARFVRCSIFSRRALVCRNGSRCHPQARDTRSRSKAHSRSVGDAHISRVQLGSRSAHADRQRRRPTRAWLVASCDRYPGSSPRGSCCRPPTAGPRQCGHAPCQPATCGDQAPRKGCESAWVRADRSRR